MRLQPGGISMRAGTLGDGVEPDSNGHSAMTRTIAPAVQVIRKSITVSSASTDFGAGHGSGSSDWTMFRAAAAEDDPTRNGG